MKSSELLKILEHVGPLSISDEFCKNHGAYDNSGILVDSGEEITGILFSLDLSAKALEEAKNKGFNAIVTHHPAIFGAIKSVSVNDDKTSLIAACLKSGITVISMHLNFDAAPEGIDYHLMQGLGGDTCKTSVKLSGGAYGRAYDIKPRKLSDYVEFIKKNFGTDRVVYYGEKDKMIKRVSSFCGAGCDDESIAFSAEEGVDALVSSDMKHHHIAALVSRGISVIVLTHYASETYGFNKIYSKIIEELTVPAAYFCDAELM